MGNQSSTSLSITYPVSRPTSSTPSASLSQIIATGLNNMYDTVSGLKTMQYILMDQQATILSAVTVNKFMCVNQYQLYGESHNGNTSPHFVNSITTENFKQAANVTRSPYMIQLGRTQQIYLVNSY